MKLIFVKSFFLILLVTIGCAALQEKRAKLFDPATFSDGATYVGNDTCKNCHEKHFKLMTFTQGLKTLKTLQ